MRRQVIGDVNTERVNVMGADSNALLVEGRDDTARRSPAPQRNTNNGVRRRNVHVGGGFGAGQNDPGARFEHIVGGYESLNRLTDAISHSFVQQDQRQIIDIVREFVEVSRNLADGQADQQDFYRQAQAALRAELDSNVCGGSNGGSGGIGEGRGSGDGGGGSDMGGEGNIG